VGIDLNKSAEEAWQRGQAKTPSLLDEYEHVGLIGEGSFSIVKHYRHRETREDFAVKELKAALRGNADYVHWLEREIKLLEALAGHENVVELVAHRREGGRHFYVTPKAETNLYDYVKRNNSTLNLEARVAIFDQVLSAVKFAHSKGFLHRDIAPTNVLLFKASDGYAVKVSDFGLGKDLQSLSNYTRSEVSHYGHIYYAAPEQREKLKDASARSDIYSLGKLLNFVLTGRDPEVLHPCEFTSVIERATRYDPTERYGDLTEFEREYEEIKSLLFSEQALSNPKTLAEYVAGGHEINWREFHRLAVAGEYSDHIYADFVAPAVEAVMHPRSETQS
jgi:serine/threonine protein kinase